MQNYHHKKAKCIHKQANKIHLLFSCKLDFVRLACLPASNTIIILPAFHILILACKYSDPTKERIYGEEAYLKLNGNVLYPGQNVILRCFETTIILILGYHRQACKNG